ncbi:general transcription factor 3C polypeptide 3 isoform X2 [Arabidopsis lyrata subsp. lyrata]|uniref:general transcription factor 3C polypeptide 3 isoform X2 n=1 Tax=Arabidopsis lyrata subsp. lyrata TaxID=81972 RepID=UPI000A29BADE|nr:general transcription factor 3C polypeptide 3 isoform X2 [Arabidopsis lyrata subsp. lyrata]|eukprot:XP_020867107.1 general transcription factor 3C polypeptide 3 isoform X2 [Arabidopsis lyrata subsp. lyrata]
MEDKGKGVVEGDEGNLEEGPSNMECDKQVLGGDDKDSDEEGLVDDDDDDDDDSDDDDEGDELEEEEDDFEAGSEIPNTFERFEYEALAERKRKALADSQRNASNATNISNSTSGVEGFMEFLSSGRRRKSRKYKKKGRRLGSKKEVAPDILKRFREALFLHAHGRDIEALPILVEVIKQAPAFDIAYYYLSRVSEQLGRAESSSTEALKIAANIKGSKSPFWKLLYERFKEQEDMAVARSYASKAIQADPDDIPLKYEYADLCLNAGKYREAAETYEQIFRRCPERIETLKWGIEYFLKSGEGERAASILEDHIKSHSSEVGHDILDLLASVFMQINVHDRALKYIHDVRQIYNVGKELSSSLKIRQAICHVHLEEMEQAESVLSILPQEAVSEHPELITNLADELTNIGNFHSALKYYLEVISEPVNNGYLFVKIARCYMSLAEREQAIVFYYKALNELSDTVDIRITLASLLLEDGKRDEAVLVLSPPENPDPDTAKLKAWWKNRKIRMNLCQIYHSEGMLEDFANTALQLVLKWVWRRTVKGKRKRLVLSEHQRNKKRRRPRDAQASQLRGGPKKWRKIRATLNETRRIRERAAIKAHNEDICSESELCKALASLQRYWEALEIVNLARRLDAKMLPVETKKELQSLGAKISCDTMDPKQWFDCVRSVIQQHPYRLNAWNCYYRVISRLGKRASSEAKFMHHLRSKYRDCVPPILIAGHHFTVTSRHQDAAREYLEAYKLMPDSPLINLCVGAALINLALGFRLKNRHECLAQGFAFLYNNLRICSDSQEALYNVARAYQHVGLVTLAASYYEKVLAIYEKEYLMPKLPNEDPNVAEERKPVNCDLRKEAAHNLHLIYKHSGAFDLARQVLKDHCSF